MAPDPAWLEKLFTSYDLYYLDPLVVKDPALPTSPTAKKPKSRFAWLTGQEDKPVQPPWYESDTEATSKVLATVREILGAGKNGSDISQFFDERILAGLSEDRGKQKQIVDVLIKELCTPVQAKANVDAKPQDRGMIVNALSEILLARAHPEEKPVHLNRIVKGPRDLADKIDSIRELPNHSKVDCLVALEGMITRVDPASNLELYQSVVVMPRHEDRHFRSIRFCLAQRPGMLLGLDEWRIGLMVDQKGLAKTYPPEPGSAYPQDWVKLNGWYPFAMVIGYWRTDRGGRPFVDVLAILIKAFPSMDAILKERVTTTKRYLLQLLEDGRDSANTWRQNLQSGTPYNPEDDYALLYPYLLATLCCRLNYTDWTQFESRGRTLFTLAKQYRDALLKLSKRMRAKKADSWLPDVVDRDEPKLGKPLPGLNAPVD